MCLSSGQRGVYPSESHDRWSVEGDDCHLQYSPFPRWGPDTLGCWALGSQQHGKHSASGRFSKCFSYITLAAEHNFCQWSKPRLGPREKGEEHGMVFFLLFLIFLVRSWGYPLQNVYVLWTSEEKKKQKTPHTFKQTKLEVSSTLANFHFHN